MHSSSFKQKAACFFWMGFSIHSVEDNPTTHEKKNLPSPALPFSLLLLMITVCISVYAQQNILYTQNTSSNGDVPSQRHYDFGGIDEQPSDDFEVPAGQTWTIEKVYTPGRLNQQTGHFNLAGAYVAIYADEAGKPGQELYNVFIEIPDAFTECS